MEKGQEMKLTKKENAMTTQTQKHTEGPWRIRHTSIGGHRAISDKNNKDIVVVTGIGEIEEEQDANARLIAAAPELLEALKLMVEQYGGMVDGGVEKNARISVEKAKQAIAKA